ncbi:MAG: hypothetical protein E7260_05800 [Lachnospiraceae bacterium]|nr:hypothetical protein [Lachnospiraceae bacterium]
MKKFLAVLLAAVMTVSLVACGGTPAGNENPTTAPTDGPTQAPTQAPQPENVTIANASINFEDGKMDFVKVYEKHATSANVALSIVDYNGSKALKVDNLNGKVPWVALDLASLLGDKIADVASVDMVIGTSYEDGKFRAVSGEVVSWWGTELDDATIGTWSVYMAKKNPKVTTVNVPAGNAFVAGANNILLINLKTDNGLDESDIAASFYLDDICFKDAAGNVIAADTSVAFVDPAGFANTGKDLSNLYVASNAVNFPGFAKSGNAWAQDGIEMTPEILAALVPGSVVEIAYTSDDGSMWLVFPDSAAGWMRVADGNQGGTSLKNNSLNLAQVTYEQIASVLGEDTSTWGARMQCEAASSWEVFSISVGTANKRVAALNTVEFEGFAPKGNAWAQDGIAMPQEIIDALVPGSVVEIDYTSDDGNLWIVMPDSAAGWMRVADGNQGGKSICVDGKCYITYEQIASVCGDDKTAWGARMQCEGSSTWEVFAARVGTYAEFPQLAGFVDFAGFAPKGDAWAQDGIEMTPEFLAALVPGSVVELKYTSADGNIWLVFPDSAAGWMRVADGNQGGKSVCADGIAYITYEQIASVLGEDTSTWGARMQCEGSSAWEVFSARVAKSVGAASEGTETPDEPKVQPADPTIQVADGTVAFTNSITFADANWWTQKDLTKVDLYGDVNPDDITAIKFTSDTIFIVGYNDVNTGSWAQFDTSNTYVVKTAALTNDDPVVCVYLSKGDGVEYTITWEVYTGGDRTVIMPEVPEEPEEEPVVLEGEVAHTGSVTFADTSWWTERELTIADLLGEVDPATVAGIKFTGTTDFFYGFNKVGGGWEQNAAALTEASLTNIDLGADFALKLTLSKGDGVEYTITWEVYTKAEGGADDILAEYVGDYGLGWGATVAELQAFTGNVTLTFDIAYTGTVDYPQFTLIDQGDSWSKLKAEDYAANAPTINSYEFIEMFDPSVTTFTTTISADAIARIIANGAGLGIQVNGIVVRNAKLTAAE